MIIISKDKDEIGNIRENYNTFPKKVLGVFLHSLIFPIFKPFKKIRKATKKINFKSKKKIIINARSP